MKKPKKIRKLILVQTKNDCFFELEGERLGGVIIESMNFKFNKRPGNDPGEIYPNRYDIGSVEPIHILVEPQQFEYRDGMSKWSQQI